MYYSDVLKEWETNVIQRWFDISQVLDKTYTIGYFNGGWERYLCPGIQNGPI